MGDDRESSGGSGGGDAGVEEAGTPPEAADRSEGAERPEGGGSAGSAEPDAGSPGGMGGVRASGGTGTDRPPGGLSPMTYDRAGESRDDDDQG